MAWFETALVLTVWTVVSVPIALLVCGAIKVDEGDTPSGNENVRFTRDGSARLAEDQASGVEKGPGPIMAARAGLEKPRLVEPSNSSAN
jgi:hypothetical protein